MNPVATSVSPLFLRRLKAAPSRRQRVCQKGFPTFFFFWRLNQLPFTCTSFSRTKVFNSRSTTTLLCFPPPLLWWGGVWGGFTALPRLRPQRSPAPFPTSSCRSSMCGRSPLLPRISCSPPPLLPSFRTRDAFPKWTCSPFLAYIVDPWMLSLPPFSSTNFFLFVLPFVAFFSIWFFYNCLNLFQSSPEIFFPAPHGFFSLFAHPEFFLR